MTRLAAIAALLAACGSDDPLVDEPCPLPATTDDLVPGAPITGLPAIANRATSVGDRVLVCGDGFVSIAEGGAITTLEVPPLAGRCGGIAAIDSDRAIVATTAGRVVLLDISGPTAAVVDTIGRPAASFFDVAVDGDRAFVAAGTTGIIRYSFAGDALVEEAVFASADARSVAPIAGALMVADGSIAATETDPGGAETRLLSDVDGALIGEVGGLTGIAARVITGADEIVVLRPGFGFDVYDVDPGSATPLALRYSTLVAIGMPLDAAGAGDDLFVAAGSQLHRYRLGASEATLVSVEDRVDAGNLLAPWFRTVAVAGTELVAITDDSLVPIAYGDGTASPEVHIEQTTFTLAPEQTEALFLFHNIGSAELVISGITADAPFSAEPNTDLSKPREGCEGQFVLGPGDSMLGWQRYAGDDSWQEAPLRIASNDADEPELVAIAEINRPQAQVGDPVDDFSLPTVDGDNFRLTEHVGVVVVAKLYNPL